MALPSIIDSDEDTGHWRPSAPGGLGLAGWASNVGTVLSLSGTECQGTDGLL